MVEKVRTLHLKEPIISAVFTRGFVIRLAFLDPPRNAVDLTVYEVSVVSN